MLNLPPPQTYDEFKAEVAESQNGMSRSEIMQQMQNTSEAAVDLDNLPKQDHAWVDRGLKLSCEGANHPHHQVWKRFKKY